MITRLLATLAVSVAAQSAIASTVTFNFADGTNRTFTNGSHTFTGSDGSSTLQVSTRNSGSTYTSYVAGSQWGLLVCTQTRGGAPTSPSGSCGRNNSDVHWIDGGSSSTDPDESVVLTTGKRVTLLGATFYNNFGSNSDFDLLVDGTTRLDERAVEQSVVFGPGNQFSGKEFAFLADGDWDYFKLKSATVDMPAVPIPAAAWLFGSALMSLTVVARRRDKQAPIVA